ncbi:MAG: transcriptional regulator, LuxR family [Deltaproteobacteria bacterium]|nr:transcriptional regulator, LuxR family [Deltaproteobacteria bacterium]
MTSADPKPGELASTLGMALMLAVLATLMIIDLVADVRVGTTPFHASIEGSAIAVAAIGAITFVRRLRGSMREAHELRDRAEDLTVRLEASRQDAERWRREADTFISGLATAIDQQLARWGLSPAEQEIALLLLKGLGHKEIAELRGVTETTVRQQARSIYRKSGLGGRHDLAAFFLEDLLQPRPDDHATHAEPAPVAVRPAADPTHA